MKKFLLMMLACTGALFSHAWSQKGHDVTAYIAEKHLTPAAKAAVDSILEGKSMVYWSNWLDNASYSMDYAYTKTWHYKNYDVPESSTGDVVKAINGQIEILGDSTTSVSDKSLALKILVHCMGDLHQPMHLGNLKDRGGNTIKVKFFDRDTNLHSIWDSSLVETGHKWSYSEWQEQIDRATAAQEAEIVAGSVEDWADQSYKIAGECYVYFQPGTKVKYDQIARWTPVVEQQLLKGGLRLAYVLNNIFR